MARRDNVRLPSSSAGITQYFEETRSKYHISPMQVIFIAVAMVVLVFLMRLI